jgi:hypothetical protein
MIDITRYPLLIFALSLVILWLSSRVGCLFRKVRPLEEVEHQDLGLVLAATLTLLGLIIGFSFSMVVSRFDQRKTFEEEEANAIGTEYLRAGLLPAADAARVRELLKNYLDKRVLFYETRDAHQFALINMQTAQLQTDLWFIVQGAAARQPVPAVALAVSGMNDVLNSQGYTQAAWLNRLPAAVWYLLAALAVFCNVLVGYRSSVVVSRFLVLPLAISLAFFLVAEIDSPRRGFIRVVPQNLISLSYALRAK